MALQTLSKRGCKQRVSRTTRFLCSELVAIAFLFSFTLSGFNADFLIIFLECGKIFTSFGKFSLFHSFPNVPMDEGSLGVHEIKLVVDAREYFSNGSGVADHADSPHNFCKIAS